VNHLKILQSTPAAQIGNGRDNLLIKTTGKFYTPKFIGERLVDNILSIISYIEISEEISIIDPFCGDGRLIMWLLEKASDFPSLKRKHWQISIWDCDEKAVLQARKAIQETANRINIKFTINASIHNSFSHIISQYINQSASDKYKFDITITNPPWEVVKPDRRDIEVLDIQTELEYINSLRRFSQELQNNFPVSMPKKMFSGWGVNLARVGLEAAIHLTKKHGIVGIVSPASFLGDQSSASLREFLFLEHGIKYIDYFPSETKLFDGVDQDCVNIIFQTNKKNQKSFVCKFDKDLNFIEKNQELKLPKDFLKSNGYVIPSSSNQSQLKQLLGFSNLKTLGDLQGDYEGNLWTGRELDETGHTKYLSSEGNHPFLKGRMVERLINTDQPSVFINPDSGLNIPPSVKYPRLVWRDVSRPTQKRRIQATIIPANWVTGNSLGVAHFRTNDVSKLYVLLCIISSIPFEFQVRSMLSTAHISVGILRKTRIPEITAELINKLVPLAKSKLSGDLYAEQKIEIVVAKSYGLNCDDLAEIIKSFPKITTEERQNLLEHKLWKKS
jgi:Alw26I/Eco31I/Esp3I family type II restriction m6 adenine DNA methyltransferase